MFLAGLAVLFTTSLVSCPSSPESEERAWMSCEKRAHRERTARFAVGSVLNNDIIRRRSHHKHKPQVTFHPSAAVAMPLRMLANSQ